MMRGRSEHLAATIAVQPSCQWRGAGSERLRGLRGSRCYALRDGGRMLRTETGGSLARGLFSGGGGVPAKNIHHAAVIEALTNDGWTVTHDPLHLSYGARDMYVDLGAERNLVAAEKGTRRIAVEVQSFLGPSVVRALQE